MAGPKNEPRSQLAAWILKQLARREWNQSDFAERLGVGTGTVSRWMRGQRPDTAYCERIADLFAVDVDLVLTLAGHRPAAQPLKPDDPAVELCGLIRHIKWNEERLETLRDILNNYRRFDQRAPGKRGDGVR